MALPGRTIAQGNPPASDHQVDQTELGDWMEEIEEGVAEAASLGTRIDTVEDDISDLQALGGAVSAPAAAGGPVAVATTENITLSGEQTIDGVLTSANRVLVKNQTVAAENGIYVTAAGAWTRATDMDAAGEVQATSVYVTGGTTNGGRTYATYSVVTTLGTDPITWVLVQDTSALAPKASPTFTGTVTVPTPPALDNTTKAASTAYVRGELAGYQPLAARNALSWFCAAAGTPDAIELTSSYSGGLVDGLTLRFRAASANTGNVTISLNGGAAFSLRTQFVSNLSGGMIKAGWYYDVTWYAAANQWRLTTIDQMYVKSAQTILIPSAVGGTENAIVVTADFAAVDASTIIFKAANTSTSPTVTFQVNGGVATNLRTATGGPLAVGEIVAGRWYMARYDATGGNPWILISSGVTLGDVLGLQASIDALDTRVGVVEDALGTSATFGAEAEALSADILDRSLTDFTWSEGVRTRAAALTYRVGSFGSSIGTGAGAGSSYAPAQMLADHLTKAAEFLYNISVALDNQSVPSTTLNQMLSQIQASAYTDHKIFLGVPGMNDFFPAAMNAGEVFTNQDNYLEGCIAEIRSNGAVPIICTSPHPHPVRTNMSLPDANQMQWPYATLNQSVNITVDVSARTFSFGAITSTVGGNMLRVGDTFTVTNSTNNGTYTIAAIDWVTPKLTTVETPLNSTTETATVKAVADEEAHVWPPASEQLITRDWTGGGVEVQGFRRFQLGNQIVIRDTCKTLDVGVIDWEMSAFRFVEAAANGWDDFYDSPNYNHMNAAGYGTLGSSLAKFVQHVMQRTLPGNRVIW